MKLEEISTFYKSDGESLNFIIVFRRQLYEECNVTLSPDTRMVHLWNLLEEHIKNKLAEKLGLEEPLHINVDDSEPVTWRGNTFGEPDTTEDHVDRDLGLDNRKDH